MARFLSAGAFAALVALAAADCRLTDAGDPTEVQAFSQQVSDGLLCPDGAYMPDMPFYQCPKACRIEAIDAFELTLSAYVEGNYTVSPDDLESLVASLPFVDDHPVQYNYTSPMCGGIAYCGAPGIVQAAFANATAWCFEGTIECDDDTPYNQQQTRVCGPLRHEDLPGGQGNCTETEFSVGTISVAQSDEFTREQENAGVLPTYAFGAVLAAAVGAAGLLL